MGFAAELRVAAGLDFPKLQRARSVSELMLANAGKSRQILHKLCTNNKMCVLSCARRGLFQMVRLNAPHTVRC